MSPKNQPRQPHIIYKASRSLKVNPQVEPCQAKTYQNIRELTKTQQEINQKASKAVHMNPRLFLSKQELTEIIRKISQANNQKITKNRQNQSKDIQKLRFIK